MRQPDPERNWPAPCGPGAAAFSITWIGYQASMISMSTKSSTCWVPTRLANRSLPSWPTPADEPGWKLSLSTQPSMLPSGVRYDQEWLASAAWPDGPAQRRGSVASAVAASASWTDRVAGTVQVI